MKRVERIIVLFSLCCCMVSCIKDEAKNQECDIESAWLEGAEYEANFYHAAEMRKENISSAETNIVFSVRSLIALPEQVPVCFKITDGATIEPASGSLQDFTKGAVNYTVTSEDGQWKRTYRVSFQEPSLPAQKFSFEYVETLTEKSLLGENRMHVFYELPPAAEAGVEPTERIYCWATGNTGAAILKSGAGPEDFPTYSTADGKEGKGVCLNTQSTGALGSIMKKPIAAGNLFLGEFIVDYVLKDALKATQFGVPNTKEPIRITGWYKYRPGEEFTDKDMNVYNDRKDEASIYAVYYRNVDDKGDKFMLDGYAMAGLDKLMDNPQVFKVAQVASLPPTDTWTRWEMFFDGKDAPDDVVEAQGFNLALVFSSSKHGDEFEGAVGSTLYIDEVEVSYEY